MSHDPKLEIYKIRLINKDDGRASRFRKCFRENVKGVAQLPDGKTDGDIYMEYYKDFLNSIDDGKGYKKSVKKEKAYKIAKEQGEDGKLNSLVNSPLNKNFIISGLLEGGKFGIKRNLGNIDDVSENSNINEKNVVGDRYYFLLYTPIDYHTGILIIQGYTEAKLSDVFRDHIKEYFKVEKKVDCEISLFVPENLKNKYLKDAVFSSAKFSSSFIVKNAFENLENNEMELEVKIEIIDKSRKKAKYKGFEKMIKSFGETIFEFPNNIKKRLDLFDKKSAKMKGIGREFPIDFHDEDNIKPTILLKDEGISITAGKIPDFKQIETYCKNLLDDIIVEIMPENAIENI